MAAWLYPISKEARDRGYRFSLKGGASLRVSLENFTRVVESGRLSEEAGWDVTKNFCDNIQPEDEIFIYTGDDNRGIIGYAKVWDIERDSRPAKIFIHLDLGKCRKLLNSTVPPVPAEIIRKWLWPRAAVESLDPHSTKLRSMLPWKQSHGFTRKRTGAIHSGVVRFGTSAQNKKVETAAVKFVKSDYRRRGWSVKSRESDEVGYDLECRKGSRVQNVEVKGTSGDVPGFFITERERQMSFDPHFELRIVLRALAKNRSTLIYDGTEMRQRFKLNPIQYQAVLKK